jgi:hypothetical protein
MRISPAPQLPPLRAAAAPAVAGGGASHGTLPPIEPPSDVGGEWPIDQEAAKRYADRTLRSLDLSKPVVVLWVSGTANPKKGEFPQIAPAFANAVYREFQDGNAGLGLMRYESSWNMRSSISTGVETLRLVLRGLKRRHKQVLLAGESQGAWVISEALKDPVAHSAITRAALWGHPAVAATHFEDGHDPQVLETNHKWDHVSRPISGDRALAMEALIALESDMSLAKVPLLARALIANPVSGALALMSNLRDHLPLPIRVMIPEHHNYSEDFLRGVEFLKAGLGQAAAGAQLVAPRKRATHHA